MDNRLSDLNEIRSLIKETQKNIKDLSISQKETDRQIQATSVEVSSLSAGQKEATSQSKGNGPANTSQSKGNGPANTSHFC